ncbi:MAG: hypothetical protein LBD90_08620 [Bifidobacteriaceae bacterium]|jgi:hypothetical protein|nr:hypothetical protein [Bifidobacteriaceae bacterium]
MKRQDPAWIMELTDAERDDLLWALAVAPSALPRDSRLRLRLLADPLYWADRMRRPPQDGDREHQADGR